MLVVGLLKAGVSAVALYTCGLRPFGDIKVHRRGAQAASGVAPGCAAASFPTGDVRPAGTGLGLRSRLHLGWGMWGCGATAVPPQNPALC